MRERVIVCINRVWGVGGDETVVLYIIPSALTLLRPANYGLGMDRGCQVHCGSTGGSANT